MTVAKNLTDFFTISERLECEMRLTRLSDGNAQAVASHSWNMIMMAIALRPHLKNPVNMEAVMELCAIHDLPEAIAHDIPLHQQTAEVKKQKHIKEEQGNEGATEKAETRIATEPYAAWIRRMARTNRFLRALRKPTH